MIMLIIIMLMRPGWVNNDDADDYELGEDMLGDDDGDDDYGDEEWL